MIEQTFWLFKLQTKAAMPNARRRGQFRRAMPQWMQYGVTRAEKNIGGLHLLLASLANQNSRVVVVFV